MSTININDLAAPEQVLSKDEMEAITGGRRFRQVRYRYRTVRRVVRKRIRVRYVRYGRSARGVRWGSWRRG